MYKNKFIMIAIKSVIRKSIQFFGFDIIKHQPESYPYAFLTHFNINTIIDVGASYGQSTIFFHKILPKAKIYAFEPLNEPFLKLKELQKTINGLEVFNYALGEKEQERYIYVNNHSSSSSMFPLDSLHKKMYPQYTNEQKEKISIKKLDILLHSNNLTSNILLFLGSNGFEKEIIMGGETVVSKATIVIMKLAFKSMYKGQPLFYELYEIAKEYGLLFRGFLAEGKRNPDDKTLVLVDAIFIRE